MTPVSLLHAWDAAPSSARCENIKSPYVQTTSYTSAAGIDNCAVGAAWKTGFVLDNVRLKVEAFDYLQLPFDIKEGIVGRIEVQVRLPELAPPPDSRAAGSDVDALCA